MLKWRGRLREPTATQPWEALDGWVTNRIRSRVVASMHRLIAPSISPGQGPQLYPGQDPGWGPYGTPSGDPLRGAPGGPGRPGEKIPDFRPPGPPRGAPPGGPKKGPPEGPKWGQIVVLFVLLRGPRGPGGPPGGPRGAKKCTFFWVFNNSPSRDKNWVFFHFFGTPILGHFGGYMGGGWV